MEYKLVVHVMPETFTAEEESTAVDRARGKIVEGVVDSDINSFDRFFQDDLKNAPLTGSERAAIKTYLGWKLGVFQG